MSHPPFKGIMKRSKTNSNQCDGCLAGKPVNPDGYHVMSVSGSAYPDLMLCQSHRYKKDEILGECCVGALKGERARLFVYLGNLAAQYTSRDAREALLDFADHLKDLNRED